MYASIPKFAAGSSTVNGITAVAGTHTTTTGNGTTTSPLAINVQWPVLAAGSGIDLTGDGEPTTPYVIPATTQGITFVSAIDGTHSTVAGQGTPSSPLQVNVTWPTLTGSSGIVATPTADGYTVTGTTDTTPIAGSLVVYTDGTGDRGTPTTPVTSSQPLQINGTVTTTGVTLTTAADNPGGDSTIWSTAGIRPDFGDNGPLALLSDLSGEGSVTNPIANELVVFANAVVSPFSLESAVTTATLHQPFVLTNPTGAVPSLTIVDTSATNTPQLKIVNAASAPTLGASFGFNAQNNGYALYFNGDISAATGYNPLAYRWGLVENNGTSLATSTMYVEYATGSTFSMAQSWSSSLLIVLNLPVNALSTVMTPSVILTTLAASPGRTPSALWWTSPSTRPNFGTSGPLALLSDIVDNTVTNPIANEFRWCLPMRSHRPFRCKVRQRRPHSPPLSVTGSVTASTGLFAPGLKLSSSTTPPMTPTQGVIWFGAATDANRPQYASAGSLALLSDVTSLSLLMNTQPTYSVAGITGTTVTLQCNAMNSTPNIVYFSWNTITGSVDNSGDPIEFQMGSIVSTLPPLPVPNTTFIIAYGTVATGPFTSTASLLSLPVPGVSTHGCFNRSPPLHGLVRQSPSPHRR